MNLPLAERAAAYVPAIMLAGVWTLPIAISYHDPTSLGVGAGIATFGIAVSEADTYVMNRRKRRYQTIPS